MRLDVDVAIRVNGVLLTPEELELLLKLSEHGSMSKVAEEKGVTRSAVHKRIRNLEERLGCRLVESSPLGSYLTEHGRRIVIKYVNAKARLSKTETTIACSETVVEDVLTALGKENDVDVIVPPHEKMSRVEADVVVPDDPMVVFDRSDEAVGEPVVVRRTRLVRVGDGGGFVEVPGSAQRIYLTDLRNREKVKPKMRVGYYASALEAVRNEEMWTVVPEELAPEGDPGPHYTVMALPLTRDGEDVLDVLES
ncbi:helix-turn-helix domain-containing protein [Methanopyrus sp.]